MPADRTLTLHGKIEREDEQYVSHCAELDLMTCAPTFEDAIRSTTDMIELYFESCAKDGTLSKVLARLGGGEALRFTAELDAPMVAGKVKTEGEVRTSR